MMIDKTHKRCPRCTRVLPLTEENYYTDAKGRVTGLCRPCHAAYLRDQRAAQPYHALPPDVRARHRLAARESNRRRRGVIPTNDRRLYPVVLDFARATARCGGAA